MLKKATIAQPPVTFASGPRDCHHVGAAIKFDEFMTPRFAAALLEPDAARDLTE